MEFVFGDIVVVGGDLIGVVVKDWLTGPEVTHEIYVRDYNSIKTYPESQIERYMVRHKELSEEETEYQYNAINNL